MKIWWIFRLIYLIFVPFDLGLRWHFFTNWPLKFVVCCCKLNNTRVCDERIFWQVSKRTGCYQLPIFGCTNVHPRRYPPLLFRRAVYWWCYETQYAHNTLNWGQFQCTSNLSTISLPSLPYQVCPCSKLLPEHLYLIQCVI